MKGSLIGFVLAGALIAATGGATGCSSSSGGGGGSNPTGAGCDQGTGAAHFCFVYTNLTAQQQSSLASACTQAMGKSVTSCPDGVGTCSFALSGYNIAETFYCGASSDQMACTAMSGATWAAGKAADACGGGDAGGSSSSSGGTGSSSGGTGSSSGGGGDAAAD